MTTNVWGGDNVNAFAIPLESAIPADTGLAGQTLVWNPVTQVLEWQQQTAANNVYTPTAPMLATNMQAAIDELTTGNLGASRVTAGDGASGSLWTTVQGFINKIISSAGASVVGFIQSGTGAVATTVQAALRDLVDNHKPLQDYASLRLYSGPSTGVLITGVLATAQPQVIAGNFAYDSTDTATGALFTGSIVGTVLTASAVTNGTLSVGQSINRGDTGEKVAIITSLGTGTGGAGTYNLSASATVASMTMTADNGGTKLVGVDGRRWKRTGYESLQLGFFDAKGNGTQDDSDAWDMATAAAIAASHDTVHLRGGANYRITRKITITEGIMFVAPGSQGSTPGLGCCITHESTDGLFLWNGNGVSARGTGGGLKNVIIVKADGYVGGNCIELLATDDNHRPGEMVFDNVFITATGTGRWTRCFVVDGTAAATAGTIGVRTIHLRKVRGTGANTVGETFLFKQVTHLYGFGVACDTGSGAQCGIKFEGINDGIYLNATGNAGTLLIVANDATNTTNRFFYEGKFGGSITVNDTQTDGSIITADTGGVAIKSPDLKLISKDAPAFLVELGTTVADVTGDGTNYNFAWDTEIYDSASAFSSTTFTCSVAGYYTFNYGVSLSGFAAAHTTLVLGIVHVGSSTKQYASYTNPYVQVSGVGGIYTAEKSITLKLAYGDTVYIQGYVSGGTKTVDFSGNSAGSTRQSYFSGKYLP